MTLILDNLFHSYDAHKTLQGVSLRVEQGEIVSLLGPSGCGKTTLLRLIAGLERLDGGVIRLDDKILASKTAHPGPEKRPVGLVFQEHALFPGMNVSRNIEFGLSKLEDADKARRRQELLEMVGLPDIADRMPGTLSGGQQQRVALARALAPQPGGMLLDEPYASVDVTLRRELRESARLLLKQANSATILVTHDPDEALEMSDRIAVMGSGVILQAGTPEQIIDTPLSPEVAQLFGEAQTIEGRIAETGLQTDLGMFDIPGGAADSMSGKAFTLVVRPNGLVFEDDAEGDFVIRDIRYRSSGRILLVGGVNAAATRFVRVAAGYQADWQVGQRGRLQVQDRGAFLFGKKSHERPLENAG